MIAKNLRFLPRDTRDHSAETMAYREYKRMKGKSLKAYPSGSFLEPLWLR